MEFAHIGTESFVTILFTGLLSFVLPIAVAIIWVVKKKEKISTVLFGALTFIIFVMILEKPIQSLILFPTQLGLKETGFSTYAGARPILLALITGLFPGVFEETGRFVAFKTVLRKCKNRETSVSYGIGHGCVEVILTIGISYLTYISYIDMINSGTFEKLVELVREQTPEQAGTLRILAEQLATIRFVDIIPLIFERLFAVLFHIGASILVFYAAREKKLLWLYPLAVLLHTFMDSFVGLVTFGVLSMPVWAIELVIAVVGVGVFLGAYILLYRKDKAEPAV